MAITSGFFNSINGDRKYNARQISRYLGGLISSGVIPNPSDSLQVLAGEGMTVQVSPGKAFIDCYWLDNDSMYAVPIEDADMVLDRIDAVVMRLDESDDARNIDIAVKKGTPSSDPQAPAIVREGSVQEYCLATVRVQKMNDDGTQEIIQADITDTRADTDVCGWVTGLIDQVDTHTLFLQWQDAYQRFYNENAAEFEAWLSDIQNRMGSSVEGALTNMINSKADKETVETLERKLLDVDIKKGDKASVQQAMILAADWKGDGAPYTCTVQLPGVTAQSVIELGLASGATEDQSREWLNGQILGGGQGAGSVTLKAHGWKPTLNLPIVAAVWN